MLEIVQGPDSIVLPASTVQLVVRVREHGEAVNGVSVRWTADSGQLSASESTSGPDGLAAVTWDLPGLQSVWGYRRAAPSRLRVRAELATGESHTFDVRAEPFRVDQMDASNDVGCGVLGDAVYCWYGWGNSPPPTPLELPGGFLPQQVAIAEDHLCVLDRVGQVACGKYPGPLATVTGAPVLHSIVAGGNRFCGLAADRTAWCWRTRPGDPLVASQVGPPQFLELAGGGYLNNQSFVCGRTETAIWCWGSNEWGQLGNGGSEDSEVPVPVSGGHDFISLRAGTEGACGVARDLSVWCWGRGPAPSPFVREPARIPGAAGPRIEVGTWGGWALRPGMTTEWQYGEFWGGSDSLIALLDIVEFATEFKNLCVRTREGFVYCSFGFGGTTWLWPNELVPLLHPARP